MKKQLEILRKPRLFLLNAIKDLSLDQLNEIPAGFNNNIIWNMGHMVAAQQGVCYVRMGLPPFTGEEFFNRYKPGTRPEGAGSAAAVDQVKELLFSSLEQLERDYDQGVFKDYVSWTTRYGVDINTIDEALRFLPFHEGLHLGCIGALTKMIVR